MPRIPRMVMKDSDQKTIYHIISRTALDGLPFEAEEKDEMVHIIQYYSRVYAVGVLGYAIMGNHFHLLVEMQPESSFSDDEVKRRFSIRYPEEDVDTIYPGAELETFRRRLCDLSSYVKDIKQVFSRFYNRRHERKGTLWSERFKSVIVQDGHAVLQCKAYIDLNAVRAGIVPRPEAYRWCSVGYHVQTGNAGGFLSGEDFSWEDGDAGADSLNGYLGFLYRSGVEEKQGKASITIKTFDGAMKEGFYLTPVTRLKYRTRYFCDSGVIGSRAYVLSVFNHFKRRCNWDRERVPKRLDGFEGIYSLKRLHDFKG